MKKSLFILSLILVLGFISIVIGQSLQVQTPAINKKVDRMQTELDRLKSDIRSLKAENEKYKQCITITRDSVEIAKKIVVKGGASIRGGTIELKGPTTIGEGYGLIRLLGIVEGDKWRFTPDGMIVFRKKVDFQDVVWFRKKPLHRYEFE